MSLLTGEPRSATVVSLGGCEVLLLDREAVAPLLAADPAVAETLSRVLAERAAATAVRLESRRERAAEALPEGPTAARCCAGSARSSASTGAEAPQVAALQRAVEPVSAPSTKSQVGPGRCGARRRPRTSRPAPPSRPS